MPKGDAMHRLIYRKRTLLITISGLVVGLAVALQPAAAQSDVTNPIDKALQQAIEVKKIPAVVAVVADRRGVTYRAAFGKQDSVKSIALAPDAIFAIASMTKPITSVAVMQLVERGRVKLGEPVSTYLPELAKVQVLEGFDETGTPKLRPAKSVPTVRQLLSHTSGYGYEFFNATLQRYAATGAIPSSLRGDDGFLKAPLLFDPGTRFEYGISTDWLGRLVETVSGQTLEAYLKEHIFKPLGMVDTFFDVPQEKQSRMVALHTLQPDGTFVQAPAQPLQPVRFFSGGGGLYSTAEDYIKFARMLLGKGTLEGKRILKSGSVAEMMRNQVGSLSLPEFRSLSPQFAKDPIVIPGEMDKFGLGFGINTKAVAGGRSAGSSAWAGIVSTYFWVDPAGQRCAVILMQALPFGEDAMNSTVREFERAVYSTAPRAN